MFAYRMRYHPRDLEFLAWLAHLPAEEEYVARCAFIRVFKPFQTDWDFKADTEALRARINPDAGKLSKLWKAARRQAEMIERTLGEATKAHAPLVATQKD